MASKKRTNATSQMKSVKGYASGASKPSSKGRTPASKKEKLFGQELGKTGRAAERGGPVNKVQKEHGEYSEQVMYANKMKNMPFKKKIEELGLQLTVAAATNPKTFEATSNFLRKTPQAIKTTFTGNPVQNVKDSITRIRMIEDNVRSGTLSAQMPVEEARAKMNDAIAKLERSRSGEETPFIKMNMEAADHPTLFRFTGPKDPERFRQIEQRDLSNQITNWRNELDKRLNDPYRTPEAIRQRATITANEDMTLIQTNRIINKAIDKQVKEAVKRLAR